MSEQNSDMQLAKLIYHRAMSIMKFTLDLEEQKYQEKGRQDDRYRFFKKQLMAHTYDNIKGLFADLEVIGLIVPTEYDENIKNGYRPTPSGGSGFLNTEEFEEWLNSSEESEN